MDSDEATRTIAKDINDYLNHYVSAADAKAAALAAMAALSSAGVTYFAGGQIPGGLQWAIKISLFLHLATLCLSGLVVFPRKPSRGDSVIFWEDISLNGDCKEYQNKFKDAVNKNFASWEYSSQNYYISKVLTRKHFWLRVAMRTYCCAILAIASMLYWPLSFK